MNFLAIVERELREHSRRKSTHWVRLGFAIVGIVSFLWVSHGNFIRYSLNTGRTTFEFLIWMTFAFAAMAGVIFSADTISREKREGTLGLLFLTNLSGFDLVLGKLVSASLTACYGFLALIPSLSTSIVFGGLLLGEFWRFIFVLANTLFLSCATGIFVSSLFRDQRLAQGTTLFLLLLFIGCDQALSALGAGNIVIPGPAAALKLAAETVYPFAVGRFWIAAGYTQLLAWCLLAGASWILPRTWQDRPAGSRIGNDGSLKRKINLSETNAFRWLVQRDLESRTILWRALFWTGTISTFVVLWAFGRGTADMACLAGWFALHSVLKLWVASQAGYRFGEDRRNGGLELLLATRLRPLDMLQSQRQALNRAVVWPLFIIGVFDLLLFVFVPKNENFLLIFGVALATLVVDLYTLSWVGMWTGLSARQSGRGVLLAVWRVLVRPWVIVIALFVMLAIPRASIDLILIWLAISILNNLFAWVGAVRGLDERFEDLAMQPQYLLR